MIVKRYTRSGVSLIALIGLIFLVLPTSSYAAATPDLVPIPELIHVENCNPANYLNGDNDVWKLPDQDQERYTLEKVNDDWELSEKDKHELDNATLSEELKKAGARIYGDNLEEDTNEDKLDKYLIIPDPKDKKTPCKPVDPKTVFDPSKEICIIDRESTAEPASNNFKNLPGSTDLIVLDEAFYNSTDNGEGVVPVVVIRANIKDSAKDYAFNPLETTIEPFQFSSDNGKNGAYEAELDKIPVCPKSEPTEPDEGSGGEEAGEGENPPTEPGEGTDNGDSETTPTEPGTDSEGGTDDSDKPVKPETDKDKKTENKNEMVKKVVVGSTLAKTGSSSDYLGGIALVLTMTGTAFIAYRRQKVQA